MPGREEVVELRAALSMAGCLVSLSLAPEMQAAHPKLLSQVGGKALQFPKQPPKRGHPCWKEETAGTNERGINRVISETDTPGEGAVTARDGR